jgi:threonine dehydratase
LVDASSALSTDPADLNPLASAAATDSAIAALSEHLRPTPLQFCQRLSDLTGANVFLKREDLQPVRSYKVRGAYNVIRQLTSEERAAGVITASAGNHAQGVAWSCALLGVFGQIFVPETTPRQKRRRITAIGGDWVELVVTGDTYDAAAAAAKATAERTGRTFVPAFDDHRTIAGQGTIGPEIIAQLADQGAASPDLLVIPVGGGGLLAGLGSWMSVHQPQCGLVGVEPAGAASMLAALAAGGPITVASVDSFVDGAAVRRAGDLTYQLIEQLGFSDGQQPAFAVNCEPAAVGDSGPLTASDTSGPRTATTSDTGPDSSSTVMPPLTVSPGDRLLMTAPEGQVCSEMLDLYQTEGVIAEPAGALAAAVLRQGSVNSTVQPAPGATVVLIVSGGNNDISRYNEVIDRSLIHEGRKHYFLVSFTQEPGQLRRFLDQILGPDDDIVLFEYIKKSNRESGPALVGIELSDPGDYRQLLARAEATPIDVTPISPQSDFFRYLV